MLHRLYDEVDELSRVLYLASHMMDGEGAHWILEMNQRHISSITVTGQDFHALPHSLLCQHLIWTHGIHDPYPHINSRCHSA